MYGTPYLEAYQAAWSGSSGSAFHSRGVGERAAVQPSEKAGTPAAAAASSVPREHAPECGVLLSQLEIERRCAEAERTELLSRIRRPRCPLPSPPRPQELGADGGTASSPARASVDPVASASVSVSPITGAGGDATRHSTLLLPSDLLAGADDAEEEGGGAVARVLLRPPPELASPGPRAAAGSDARERIQALAARLRALRSARETSIVGSSWAPAPRRLSRRLWWDVERCANVIISDDRGSCLPSAAKALAEIAALEEPEGRPHCYYIPMFALGAQGFSSDASNGGVWSFRVSLEAAAVMQGAARVAVGLATASFSAAAADCEAAPVFLFSSEGCIMDGVGSAGVPFGEPYTLPAVVEVVLDMRLGCVSFGLDGRRLGVAFRFAFQCAPPPLFPLVVFSHEGVLATLLDCC